MSTRFSNYVTSIGFSLELSKYQIATLNSLAAPANSITRVTLNYGSRTLLALWDRGLVDRNNNGEFVLSKAGKLLLPMLDLAGLLVRDKTQSITATMFRNIKNINENPERSRKNLSDKEKTQ